MMAPRALVATVLLLSALVACGPEPRAPTGPFVPPTEEAILRFERSAGPQGPEEILTLTGLGHVTWREVHSGAVARLRISIDELLALERAFDDAEFSDLPATVRGSRCPACPTLVLTRGIGAGERSVLVTGEPQDHSPELAELVGRLSALAARAQAVRRAALGGGGTARDRLESGLEVALSLGSAVVRPGEPLYLQLTLSNPTGRPIRLSLSTSRTADFVIQSLDGRTAWSLSGTRAALEVPNELVLAPGESRTFEEMWMGRTLEGAPAERGSYLAIGVVPESPGGGETPPVAFQVR